MTTFRFLLLGTLLWSNACFGHSIKLLLGVDADSYYQSSPSYAQIKKFLKDALNSKSIEVEFIDLPSARITVSANTGIVDSDPLTSESEYSSFDNLVVVPFPYYKFKMATIRNKNAREKNSNGMICGPRWTQVPLKKTYEQRGLKFAPVEEYQQCLKMVSFGRIEFGAISQLVLEDLRQRKDPLLEKIAVSDDLLYAVDLYMVLNKKHRSLVPTIEQALRDQLKLRDQYPLISRHLAKK